MQLVSSLLLEKKIILFYFIRFLMREKFFGNPNGTKLLSHYVSANSLYWIHLIFIQTSLLFLKLDLSVFWSVWTLNFMLLSIFFSQLLLFFFFFFFFFVFFFFFFLYVAFLFFFVFSSFFFFFCTFLDAVNASYRG